MKTFIDIVKEVGPFGAISLVLIAYVTSGGADLSVDNILKMTLPAATGQGNAINRVVLLVSLTLILVQFIHAAQRTKDKAERAEEHWKHEKAQLQWQAEKDVSALNRNIEEQKRELEKCSGELADIKKRLMEDQTLVARRDQESHQLLEIVRSHAALSDDDDPRFISRVVKSADRLREELRRYIDADNLLDVSREMALYIQWATMTFIVSVEHIEYESKKNLHDADFRIDELGKEHENYFRTAHNAWRERIQTLLRGISYGRGDVNFTSF